MGAGKDWLNVVEVDRMIIGVSVVGMFDGGSTVTLMIHMPFKNLTRFTHDVYTIVNSIIICAW